MDNQKAHQGRWAVAAMFFVNGFIMGAWAPQIPLLLPRHHINEAVLGLMILTLGLGAVGSMLFAGKLIAVLGSRRMVIGFAVFAAPTLPLVVLAPNLWLLAPAMALMGGLLGCMDVSMNANAVEVERRLGRAIMSSSHGFWSLGGFVGGSIGGLALARFGAVEQAFGVGVISLIVALVASRFLWREPSAAVSVETGPKQKIAMFPRVPGLYVLGAMALFSMIAEGSVLDWAALYLIKGFDTPLASSGLAYGFFACSMAGMRFLGDSVRNRFGAANTLKISGLIGAVGVLIAAIAPNDYVAIFGFAISGLGIANMVPILFSAAGNFPGLNAGSGIATVTMLGYSGILIAPSAIGFAAQTIGYRVTYAIMAVLLIAVALASARAASADWKKSPAP